MNTFIKCCLDLLHVDLTGSWFSDPVDLVFEKYWAPLDTGRDFSRVLSKIVDPFISVLRDSVVRRTAMSLGTWKRKKYRRFQT